MSGSAGHPNISQRRRAITVFHWVWEQWCLIYKGNVSQQREPVYSKSHLFFFWVFWCLLRPSGCQRGLMWGFHWQHGWVGFSLRVFVPKWHCTLASMRKCRSPVLRVLKNKSDSSGSCISTLLIQHHSPHSPPQQSRWRQAVPPVWRLSRTLYSLFMGVFVN